LSIASRLLVPSAVPATDPDGRHRLPRCRGRQSPRAFRHAGQQVLGPARVGVLDALGGPEGAVGTDDPSAVFVPPTSVPIISGGAAGVPIRLMCGWAGNFSIGQIR
jgi:hypothetical protein